MFIKSSLRVALVHDDLVQWGGAERILLGFCEIFPDAPIFTSVFDSNNNSISRNFSRKKIITSFLQKIPQWKFMYKTLLPFYSLAFEQFNFDEFDLVISHTTRFAKSIITKPHTIHICYCHTPPRFLWHFSDKLNYGLGEILLSKLRIFDQISAQRVDYFIAGSENSKKRIKKIYQKDSEVIYPFVDLDRFQNIETFDGDYFVVISRLNKYKKVDLAVTACLQLGLKLKIIGDGPQMQELRRMCQRSNADYQIEFLGNISDEMVVLVLAGAKALIIPGIEDFGLAALEAHAAGKPVIAFRGGGTLETVIAGQNGILFDTQSVEGLTNAIKDFDAVSNWNKIACQRGALKFSKDNFINKFKQVIAQVV